MTTTEPSTAEELLAWIDRKTASNSEGVVASVEDLQDLADAVDRGDKLRDRFVIRTHNADGTASEDRKVTETMLRAAADEIRRLERERAELRDHVLQLLNLIEHHADLPQSARNGVTDPSGARDEGEWRAWATMEAARLAAGECPGHAAAHKIGQPSRVLKALETALELFETLTPKDPKWGDWHFEPMKSLLREAIDCVHASM